jgi:DNA-binding MarR family transcriptional regulator
MENLQFILKLRNTLQELRSTSSGAEIPIQQICVLLHIAANPSCTIGEIADEVGMAQSSASRAVSALSSWSWTKKGGRGLVEKTEDLYESRRKLVQLTPEGRALIKRLQEVFEK